MRSASLFACVLTLTLSARAQITPTAIFPSQGTQQNTPGATLTASGTLQAPGNIPSANLSILAAGSPSTTVCHQSFGSTTFPFPGSWNLTGQVTGAPGSPIAVALEVIPGSFFCGGFAGTPCMTGPLLFASTPTPLGILHLTPNMQILLDGIWNTAPGASLDANGIFALAGTGPIDTVTNGGVEQHFAVQAAVADPTAPSGVSLTACMTVAQWVFWL